MANISGMYFFSLSEFPYIYTYIEIYSFFVNEI